MSLSFKWRPIWKTALTCQVKLLLFRNFIINEESPSQNPVTQKGFKLILERELVEYFIIKQEFSFFFFFQFFIFKLFILIEIKH